VWASGAVTIEARWHDAAGKRRTENYDTAAEADAARQARLRAPPWRLRRPDRWSHDVGRLVGQGGCRRGASPTRRPDAMKDRDAAPA